MVTSRHIYSRNLMTMPEDNNSIIIYQSEDGNTRIDVKFTGETVWLSQQQLCELYNTSKANVSEHIKHIFQDGELEEESVVRKFRTTATDGKTYNVTFYNLDMIISLGYRIRSVIATRFRRWATELNYENQRLAEELTKNQYIMIDEILRHNRKFVTNKEYERFLTSKYPDKKIAIVTCMDTRLVELLPAALGLRNGDVKIIKNAGGVITNPFDSTMRSLLIAVYELGVEEIMVIGHTGCGVQGMNADEMLRLMKERGVSESNITLMRHCGIDLDSWLHGFDEVEQSVSETVDLIRNHPLMTSDIRVAGYVIDSVTGELHPL